MIIGRDFPYEMIGESLKNCETVGTVLLFVQRWDLTSSARMRVFLKENGLLLTNKIRSAFKRRHLMRNKRLKNFAERLIFSEISISFGENGIISEPERTLPQMIPIILIFPSIFPYTCNTQFLCVPPVPCVHSFGTHRTHGTLLFLFLIYTHARKRGHYNCLSGLSMRMRIR